MTAGTSPAPHEATQNTRARTVRRPRLVALTLLVALVAIAIDQLTKVWAVAALTGRAPYVVVDNVLQFRLIRNSGAAFSFLTGSTWVFTVIASVVAVAILFTARRLGSRLWAVALGLLLGGAVGNLIDRLVREPSFGHGHVVDFLELPHWPVFNLADSSICVAAVLIAWLGIRGIGLDGTQHDTGAAPPAPVKDDEDEE